MSGSLRFMRGGRAGSTRRATWRTVLGLVLVPLTVAGVLLWGLWSPEERLGTVTAAVVNLDEPVEVDGRTVPLGRVLAAELIAEDADGSRTDFDWVLTDSDDAAKGLDDGRYASVVTIPENFSRAATSLAEGPDAATRADIDVATSDRGRLLDSALSGVVTRTATTVLNRQLGEQFVGSVFVGMNELRSGVSDAADGADRLADGGEQLAKGTKRLADGAEQLDGGASQLAGGAGELANGAGGLSSGAAGLSTGASELSSGVDRYADGAADLAQAYQPLETGTIAAATQLKTLVGALEQLQLDAAAPQQQLSDGLASAGSAAEGIGAEIESLVTSCVQDAVADGTDPATATPDCRSRYAPIAQQATALGAGLTQAGTGASGIGAAMETFEKNASAGADVSGGDAVAKLDELIEGSTKFGTGLDSFANLGAELSSGASRLAGGASELSGGASRLAGGASTLATGTSELAASTPELSEGASQLAGGAKRSAQGAGELASGLRTAQDEIPAYDEAERDRMAELAIEPVRANGSGDELFNAAGAPLFAGIALWAGAFATFLLLAPLWSRTREAARGVAAIALRSALPAVAIGAAQGLVAGLVMPGLLGYELGRGAAFLGLAVLTGSAFGLVVQGLSALLHGFGRFAAFALLVIAFAAGIVATVPAPLRAIGDASPIGAALSGFQAIAVGASGAGGAALLLVLWGAAGLMLTGLAVARARRRAV